MHDKAYRSLSSYILPKSESSAILGLRPRETPSVHQSSPPVADSDIAPVNMSGRLAISQLLNPAPDSDRPSNIDRYADPYQVEQDPQPISQTSKRGSPYYTTSTFRATTIQQSSWSSPSPGLTSTSWTPSGLGASQVASQSRVPRGSEANVGTTLSFSISAAGSGPRRRGPLTEEQRKRTAYMRKIGACAECRRKKVSVSHYRFQTLCETSSKSVKGMVS